MLIAEKRALLARDYHFIYYKILFLFHYKILFQHRRILDQPCLSHCEGMVEENMRGKNEENKMRKKCGKSKKSRLDILLVFSFGIDITIGGGGILESPIRNCQWIYQ